MKNQAKGTLPRGEKGPLGAPPALEGKLKSVADAVTSWPGIQASVHWSLDHSHPDGVDFYVGDTELGHVHLGGSIHLATSSGLGKTLVAERLAKPFRYQDGWVEQSVDKVGAEAAIALFRRNYYELRRRKP